MRSEPHWLTPDEVIELNQEIVADTGEPHFVRDFGLLESALGRPYNHWAYEEQDDTVTLATTLLVGIARNHAFEQGNKRTAFEAMLIFLADNGYGVTHIDDLVWAAAVIAVVDHRMSEAEFEAMLRRLTRPYD